MRRFFNSPNSIRKEFRSNQRNRSFEKRYPLAFERLEPRRVLTSTLFIDFGSGFGPDGLTISDAESASLNGPEIFGAETRLGKFADDVSLSDSQLNQLITDVSSRVAELYAPFDVQIQTVQAASVGDIASVLTSASENDAYIFVGGRVSSIVDDVGAAIVDSGNSEDNLGFVFTSNFDVSSSARVNSLAAYIAKQAGYTFGLNATESSLPIGEGNVMATPGTNASGGLTGDAYVMADGWGFIRADLQRQWVNGVSPGVENSFEVLLTNLGANPIHAAHHYTTTGADDLLEVRFESETTATISLNGNSSPILDISDGLVLQTISGIAQPNHRIHFFGSSIVAEADAGTLKINERISIQDLFGNIYVQTGDFDDTLILSEDLGIQAFKTGDGDDTIRLREWIDGVDSQSGNDRFIVETGEASFSSFDAGPGFDTMDYSEHSKPGHNVSDLLIWDVNDDGFTFGFEYTNPEIQVRQTGFEHAVGNPALESTTDTRIAKGFCSPNCDVPIFSKHLTTEILGDSTTIVETSSGRTLSTEYFDGYWGDQVFVRATSRPLTIFGGAVQLGTTRNVLTSDLPHYNFDIRVIAPYAILANRDGGALHLSTSIEQRAFFGSFDLPGGGRLDFPGVYTPQGVPVGELVIDGSNTEADIIRIGNVYEPVTYGALNLTINGNGGDDYIEFGSSLEEHGGDLSKVFGENVVVRVDGGLGDDYLYLNNEANVSGLEIRLTDESISHDVSTPFKGFSDLQHQDFEVVRLTVSDQGHTFRVAPSTSTLFMIESETPPFYSTTRNRLALIGDVPRSRDFIEGETDTWYFHGEAKLVLATGIELYAQHKRLAVASQPGSPAQVRVFEPETGRLLFDIFPYDSSNTAGVQVDTADLTGDGFEEIIVAPGWNHLSEVKIFDGRDGRFMDSFFAFPAESEIQSENFRGGVDLVVGDLMGGPALEIATSTLWGTSDVRIYTAFPSNIQLRLAYNPFPNDDVRGVRIAESTSEHFQGLRLVATTAAGNPPKVQIGRPGQDKGFEGYAAGYLGGFNVAGGEIDGEYGYDVLLAGVNTGSVADPFSGQVRIFGRQQLPDSFASRPEPQHVLQAFDRIQTRGLSLATFDTDLDGRTDLIAVAQSKTSNQSAGEIKLYRVTDEYTYLDSIFANDSVFENGIELG